MSSSESCPAWLVPRVGPLAGLAIQAYAHVAVLWLGRIIGGIAGFVAAIVVSEVFFPASDNELLAAVVTAVSIVVGVVIGSTIARRLVLSG